MKLKQLILFTSSYPFGKVEPFLETEILYLSNQFHKVIIFHGDHEGRGRDLPVNVQLYRNPTSGRLRKIIFSSFQVFSQLFWDECTAFRKREGRRISFLQAKIALVSLFRAKEIKKKLHQYYPENEDDSLIFYSYWCDDSALALALRKSGKRVCRAHGWDIYFEANESKYLPYRNLIGHSLDAIIPISNKGVTYINERWQIDNPTTIFVQRLGVQIQNKGIRSKKNSVFQLVSCSSLIELKRVDLIAQTLLLLPEDVQLHWTHIGDGPEMAKVKQLVDGLKSNIDFNLKGFRSNQEVLEWYQESLPDLFINVSTTEGIPVSIMEAMSFGTPVIATNVGGTSEIVNETNGALVDVSISASALAIELQKWIDFDENTMIEYRKAAFDTCEEHFNANKNYTEFVEQLIRM